MTKHEKRKDFHRKPNDTFSTENLTNVCVVKKVFDLRFNVKD